MSTQAKTNKFSYLLKCIIGLVILAAFWLLPPFGQLTLAGMKLLGLFIMVIYFCIVNEIAWPSVLAVVGMSVLLMDIYPDTAMSPLYRAVELSWGYNIIIFVIRSFKTGRWAAGKCPPRGRAAFWSRGGRRPKRRQRISPAVRRTF